MNPPKRQTEYGELEECIGIPPVLYKRMVNLANRLISQAILFSADAQQWSAWKQGGTQTAAEQCRV